ncbi:unnamed protein product [Scytosiphon promiscuus]
MLVPRPGAEIHERRRGHDQKARDICSEVGQGRQILRFRANIRHRANETTLSDFEEALRGISNNIALVDGLEQRHQLLLVLDGRLRPPTLPKLAAVPQGTIELIDVHI